ncbi:MAG: DNRLRE domain-containing protein [Phycisphaerales bacterium]|nr:DNRLRE domain-containing protein [Phycisphaerales bacterium]
MVPRSRSTASLGAILLAAWPAPVPADSVDIAPSKDNTLYEDPLGTISNGSGASLFMGRNGTLGGNLIRRALVRFDVAAAIPSGATIDGVALTIRVLQVRSSVSRPARLHTVLADWGEGTSNSSPGGGGAPSAAGDATWLHRFSPGTSWTTAGGDFTGTPVASINITTTGTYTWTSTPAMVTGVQNWLDNPATNFGWLIRGEEGFGATAKRLGSRNSPNVIFRPVLTVQFTPVPADTCCVGGGCQTLGEVACAQAGGTYQGTRGCTSLVCNVCCVGGACQALDSIACGLAGGSFQGTGGCDDETCVIGACCEPSAGVCNDRDAFACDAAGGTHFPGTLCGSEDCNDNQFFDRCEVLDMTSPDVNGNGVPDECECVTVDLFGDVNHDMSVDIFDILCVLDGFAGVFVDCAFADVDLAACRGDGSIDIFDILAVLGAFAGELVCPPCP